jgi:serine/threonine protein kinase
VTQRDAPSPLLDDGDEDEEKTTVGGAPEGFAPPPGMVVPPRVQLQKPNTSPTPFTPVAAPTPRSDAGPPKSQPIPRPPGTLAHQPEPRGSSGPQPLAHKAPGRGPTPIPPPVGSAPISAHLHTPGPITPPQGAQQMMYGQPSYEPSAQGQGASSAMVAAAGPSLGFRADQAPREGRSSPFAVMRSRAYSFVLDVRGLPIELGSGRFAKVFLAEERWLESKTDFRRPVVVKILQKGVGEEDHMRFQMEMELLERVQGHPNIVALFASGEGEDLSFLPPSLHDKCETEFMILERLDMSLEERLKGSRNRAAKEDLLACDLRDRLFRVLDYMIPVASAIEYAHLVRNICHRDIKPANVLVGIPDSNLRGSTLQVRLADFNVAKLSDEEVQFGMTQMKASVPGTLFFQSPEQETNVLELLVNVQQGLPEVEYFEDFYIQIAKNDSFSLFNRNESYPILYADRTRKRLVLARPYRETSETNVRARIQKSVGRPADIYSLGATFYYLISGAYANPKTLYDAFHKFVEYERSDENNTIEAYLRHEYSVINSLRAPKTQDGQPEVAPADRFFSYKHYLDGNGELIDPNVMLIIAKCMIRNKPDSYCQAHDLDTHGVTELVADLINLYSLYGFSPGVRPTHLVERTTGRKPNLGGGRLRRWWQAFVAALTGKRKA